MAISIKLTIKEREYLLKHLRESDEQHCRYGEWDEVKACRSIVKKVEKEINNS